MMIDRRILASSLAALVATLSGCPSPSPSGTVTLEALPRQVAMAQCSFADRCGGLDVYEQYILREQITDCPAQLTASLEGSSLAPIRAGVADGSIRYRADLAAACIAEYTAAECGGLGFVVSACLDIFEGTLADGTPCSHPEQCSARSTCDTSRTGMCPSGVCVHVPQVGEACETTCAIGARCSSGTCVAEATAGQACDVEGSSACASGLQCIATAGSPSGTCGTPTPAAVGQPCGSGCQTGLVCSAVNGLCRQARTDGTCERTFFGSGDCDSGEECVVPAGETEGDCGPLPTVGEPCTSYCARGSRCGGSPGVCTVTGPNGTACETDAGCASGYCASGTCADAPLCRPS